MHSRHNRGMKQHLRLFLVALILVSSTAFLLAASPASTSAAAPSSIRKMSLRKNNNNAKAATSTPTSSEQQQQSHHIELILCRHGETCHNAEGRCQGMEDVSRLTDQGESQARELGRAIAGLGQRIDRVFISPLARARHTFDNMEKQWRAVGFKEYPRVAPTFVPEIQEICLYEWQGHLRKDLQAQFPEQYENWMSNPAVFKVGDKYPVRELWTRARHGWQQILSQSTPGERVLVVAHSGINQALCFSALGHDESMYRRLNFPNCGALHLRLALPTSVEEAQQIVTLPVTDDGIEHYRRLHPPEWEPEVHLPMSSMTTTSSTTTKEPVGASSKR